jgi:hypothetical protein
MLGVDRRLGHIKDPGTVSPVAENPRAPAAIEE